MKNRIINKLFFLIIAIKLINQTIYGQVKIVEKIMTIPTYETREPNPMPRFFEGRGHQGVQRREYPYPVDDNLVFEKTNVDYPYIQLENEFIDIGIIPALGGRIYYAMDKTNNYDWFYHNHVVKPSLIGMVGNWISGSLAWGYPHHHGPNTVKSMNYKIVCNEDSSKTVWISNTDRRHRLSILVGYTIFPNSSIIEMTIKPMNHTPVSNSFLFWANPAVHVDSTYQVIFPPSVQYVTFHAKREMTSWPVADRWYNNYDFTDVDISWWKNTYVPSSFFAWDPKEGYFAGYDHGEKAGTAWIGNPYLSPGMKYWADGNNAAGRLINSGLTDEDGQYLELMAGLFTDNQPDYSWIQPYENKFGKMAWFPIRELSGMKYANRNGALNIEVSENKKVGIRINTTSRIENAKVILKNKERILFEETINISPALPYVKDNISIPEGIVEEDLSLTLLDDNDESLLFYFPGEYRPPDYPMPEPLKPIPTPKEIETIENLYLAGLRLYQFYNPSVDPMPYFNEALMRDSGDYRVNTQLGIMEIKNYNWQSAERYLRTAVNRITSNYTRPKDCEALYYLGLALEAQNKSDEAYEYLYRASWDKTWTAASYFHLAQIDCKKAKYNKSLEHLDKCLSLSPDHVKALNLKIAVLRKSGNCAAAESVANEALKYDLMNHRAMNEMYLLSKITDDNLNVSEKWNELSGIMGYEVQTYIELASSYLNSGFYSEAYELLSHIEGEVDFPMLHYYLGYCMNMLGNKNKASNYYETASGKPYKYCFPFRAESILVLQDAMKLNPEDSKAPYYLGNLLYEHQPEKAIKEWEKSRQLDSSFYIVHRNLGIAYKEVENDFKKSLNSYETAVSCNNSDPRLLFELDEVYTLNRVPLKKRYEFLKDHLEVAQMRSETLLRLATRTVELGKYDEAIDIFHKNEIIESEGAREMRNTYLNAYALRSLEYIKRSKFDKALDDIEAAIAYPIGINGISRKVQLFFIKGLIYEKSGNNVKAHECYNNALDVKVPVNEREQDYMFYYGLCLQKLNSPQKAKELYQEILKRALAADESSAFFTHFERAQSIDLKNAEKHYLAGLAYQGIGNKEKAREEFKNSLRLNPDHIWSKVFLNSTVIH